MIRTLACSRADTYLNTRDAGAAAQARNATGDGPGRANSSHGHTPTRARDHDAPESEQWGLLHAYPHYIVLDVGRDFGAVLSHVHVDLAPDTQVRQVDARLDREADPRDQRAGILGRGGA